MRRTLLQILVCLLALPLFNACGPPRIVRETVAPESAILKYVAAVRSRKADRVYALLGPALKRRFPLPAFKRFFAAHYTLIRQEAERLHRALKKGRLDTALAMRLGSRIFWLRYEHENWVIDGDPGRSGLGNDALVALKQVRQLCLSGDPQQLIPHLSQGKRIELRKGLARLASLIDKQLKSGRLTSSARKVVIGSVRRPWLVLTRIGGVYRITGFQLPVTDGVK